MLYLSGFYSALGCLIIYGIGNNNNNNNIKYETLVIIQRAGIMKAMRNSCVVYAIPSLIMVYEGLGVNGFSKYGTFNFKVKISWNAGNVEICELCTTKYFI
jgi:hypothetical protein